MKKTFVPALFLLIGTAVLAQDASQQPEPPRSRTPFSINVDLVELHVAVADSMGRPIGGLGKEHFKVKENNINQPITVFKHEDLPLSLGLVVDNSRSIEPRKSRLDAAAVSFIEKSNPDDETFIVHFDSEVRLSRNFTNDRSRLRQDLASATPYGETALYDAVMLAIDTMAEARYSKKALLVITDGIDNRSKSTLEEVVARASRDNVMIFSVGLLSKSGGLKAEDSLISIAEATGGRAYFPQTVEEARVMIDLIAKDLREQYTIAYLPTNSLRDGRWRSVRVELQPPKGYPKDLNLTYRHGYYAPEHP